MKRKLVLLILTLVLAGCGPLATSTPETDLPDIPEKTEVPDPQASILPPNLASGIGAPPENLLLQYDIMGGFWAPEAGYPFGRVPRLTLFEDGTLVYVLEEETDQGVLLSRAMRAHLSDSEAAALVEQVLALGFERLKSHAVSCPPPEWEDQTCLADGSFHIFRVRLPSRELSQVVIYEHFANDAEAYQAIRALLGSYSHPGAEIYTPQEAGLIIAPDEGFVSDPVVNSWPPDLPWPEKPDEDAWLWAQALAGEELASFMEAVSTNMGAFYFEQDGELYRVVLVPWLPGVDYSEELAGFQRPERN